MESHAGSQGGQRPHRQPATMADHYPTDARVAQLDRASAFEAEGWGFESLRACCSTPS